MSADDTKAGLNQLWDGLQTIRRTPQEKITQGALGMKAQWRQMFNQDMANKLRIDAAEQLAAAKDRQPEMQDVELMTEDDVRIGDEIHIHWNEPSNKPATPPPVATPSTTETKPAEVVPTKQASTLGTVGTLLAGAALMGSGMGLAQVPGMLSSDPPAATTPHDNDTLIDTEIRGGIPDNDNPTP